MIPNDTSDCNQLIEILMNGDAYARADAAHDLGWCGDSAIDVLVSALNDENQEVRRSAIQSLGRIGGERVFAVLAKLLDSSDVEKRFRAIHALGDVGDKRAIQPLLAILEDETEWFNNRLAAASSLGNFQDDRIFEPLIKALNATSLAVRSGAVTGLRRLRDKRAIAPLVNMLTSEPEEAICATIIYALAEFGDMSVLPTLEHIRMTDERDGWPYGLLSELAAVAAASIKVRAMPIDAALSMYQEADIHMRLGIVQELGKNADPQITKFLINTLHGPHLEVRKQAIWALEKVGGTQVRQALQEATISDDETGQLARIVLNRMV